MGWVLSDIIQFSVSIIQIVWVPQMSICLDKFWIIVSITQFSNFWVMSYGNWKHILGVFSFQNSIFNSTFVIKPIYPVAMFDKQIFFFFFGETQPQLLILKTGSEFRCQTRELWPSRRLPKGVMAVHQKWKNWKLEDWNKKGWKLECQFWIFALTKQKRGVRVLDM